MRSVTSIILLTCVTKAYAYELDTRDSMNKLVIKFVDKLFDRASQTLISPNTNLDGATLAKSGQLATPSSHLSARSALFRPSLRTPQKYSGRSAVAAESDRTTTIGGADMGRRALVAGLAPLTIASWAKQALAEEEENPVVKELLKRNRAEKDKVKARLAEEEPTLIKNLLKRSEENKEKNDDARTQITFRVGVEGGSYAEEDVPLYMRALRNKPPECSVPPFSASEKCQNWDQVQAQIKAAKKQREADRLAKKAPAEAPTETPAAAAAPAEAAAAPE